jgi:hypothetical protein
MAWLVDHVAIVDEAGNPVDRAALRDDVLLGTHDHDHEDSDDESDAGQAEGSPYSEEQ